MKQLLVLLALITFAQTGNAQNNQQKSLPSNSSQTSADAARQNQQTTTQTVALTPAASPQDLAKAALRTHGGDKLKNLQTLIMRGSVDVSSAAFPGNLAGGFAIVFKGDNYRLQIQSPVFNFIQTFDGVNTNSSVGNVQIPPINRVGLPLLAKVGTEGYVVSAVADKKKSYSFRVTSPEGFAADFTLDQKTGQVKSYSAQYEFDGRQITTSVEHDKFKEVKGVLLPEKYSQRFDAAGQTFYASFKAKELLVDDAVADDVFVLE